MTTDSRIEELMKKGFCKLSFAEKAELNNLMAQNLQESQAEQFNKVIAEVKALIEKNGLTITEVVKALVVVALRLLNLTSKFLIWTARVRKNSTSGTLLKAWAFRQSMLKNSRMPMLKLKLAGQRQRVRNGSKPMTENGFLSMPNN